MLNKEHLIWPVLSLDSNYVYDNDQVIFTGGGNGPYYGIEMKDFTKESIFYIQAILNHWLMELLVLKERQYLPVGGYYSHGKQFVSGLPIYRIDFSNTEQKETHDYIVEKVHLLETLNMRLDHAQTSSDRSALERAIQITENDLSAKIDALYGVEGLQVIETDESN